MIVRLKEHPGFGRWDTNSHPIADVHPGDVDALIFPGQDYNNARILDFQQVDKYAGNTLSILESARMPWHDVSTGLRKLQDAES